MNQRTHRIAIWRRPDVDLPSESPRKFGSTLREATNPVPKFIIHVAGEIENNVIRGSESRRFFNLMQAFACNGRIYAVKALQASEHLKGICRGPSIRPKPTCGRRPQAPRPRHLSDGSL